MQGCIFIAYEIGEGLNQVIIGGYCRVHDDPVQGALFGVRCLRRMTSYRNAKSGFLAPYSGDHLKGCLVITTIHSQSFGATIKNMEQLPII